MEPILLNRAQIASKTQAIYDNRSITLSDKKRTGSNRSPEVEVSRPNSSMHADDGNTVNLLEKQIKQKYLREYYKNKRAMRDEADYKSIGDLIKSVRKSSNHGHNGGRSIDLKGQTGGFASMHMSHHSVFSGHMNMSTTHFAEQSMIKSQKLDNINDYSTSNGMHRSFYNLPRKSVEEVSDAAFKVLEGTQMIKNSSIYSNKLQ